jgi:hypothetical protein
MTEPTYLLALTQWVAIVGVIVSVVSLVVVAVMVILNNRYLKIAQNQADLLISYLRVAQEQARIAQEQAIASNVQAEAANQSLAILQQQIKADEQRAKIVLRRALQTVLSNTAAWRDRLSSSPLYVPRTVDLMPAEWSFAVYASAQIGSSAYEGMLRAQEHINAARPAIEDFVSADYSGRAAYSAARRGKQAKENLEIAQTAIEEVMAMIQD